MIRVGVDAWNLPHDRRGIGRYLREILREWRERFASRVDVTLVVPEWHTWTVRGRYRDEAGESYRVVSRALHPRARLDVLWFPWNGCSWTKFSLPAVATLHDASNFVVGGYAPDTQTIFRNAARLCQGLITDSEFSRRELARELAISPERIVAIPLGVRPLEERGNPSIDAKSLEPYVLYAGTSERRKGVDVLIRAMEILAETHPHVGLVLAGTRGDAVSGNEAAHVRELGFVDDATLAELYRHASVFAFPSRYEGFGLPPVEAMLYGSPVVTTNASSLPEATGGAATYVPPDDPAALAAELARILDDQTFARELRARGLAWAQTLSWTATAGATLRVLENGALKTGIPRSRAASRST